MISYKKQKGFSLIEVMMTLLVLSLVLVLMAPFMTKKFKRTFSDGVVFEYSDDFKAKNGDNNNYCIKTEYSNSDDNTPNKQYVSSSDCSEYEFTVPKGVTKVNITLVAGGGGGGGASGLLYWIKTNLVSKSYGDFISTSPGNYESHSVFSDDNDFIQIKNLKNLVINYITAEGQPSNLPECAWVRHDSNNGQYAYRCVKGGVDEDAGTATFTGIKDSPFANSFMSNEDWNEHLVQGDWEHYTGEITKVCIKKTLLSPDCRLAVTKPYYTGHGGASSPALYNYEVPKRLYRYFNLSDIINGRADTLSLNLRGSAAPADKPYESYKNYNDFKGLCQYEINPNINIMYTDDVDKPCVYYSEKKNEAENPLIARKGSRSIIHADLNIGKINGNKFKHTYEYIVGREGKKEEKKDEHGNTITENGKIQYNYLIKGIIKTKAYELDEASQVKESTIKINIPDSNILKIRQGEKNGYFWGNYSLLKMKIVNKDSVLSSEPALYLGGAGGDLSAFGLGECGAGAQGYGFSSQNSGVYTTSYVGGPACVSATATYIPPTTDETDKISERLDQKPGGMGGSGGSAVRIVGFDVIPGETYIIRVGKGGKGGKGGIDGYRTLGNKNNANQTDSTVEPKNGENGEGGTSTSIWRKDADGNQALIFLVTGGNGGLGGRNTGFSISGASQANIYKTNHFLISRQAENGNPNIAETKFDPHISRTHVLDSSGGNHENTSIIAGLNLGSDSNQIIGIEHTYLSKRPFIFLNYVDNYEGRCYSDSSNTCSSGYYNFNLRGANNAAQFISVRPDGSTEVNAYNGLYYKTYSKNGGVAYVGGLGGFSGLGTKAGCGGMFMGNSRGIIEQSGAVEENHQQRDLLINRIISPINTDFGENNHNIYNIFDYYDNCNLDTPDGQSAKYVSPNIKEQDFGNAGSGGGGGGYTIDDGAGKGGDGQNGYLMIDWRKQ